MGKTSETIKQQKKARQEFLELKKMQNGEIETGPKPSEVAIVPKTPSEKIKNFWYYNKIKIIAIAFALFFIAFAVTQCVNRIDYDIKIVYYTNTPIFDEDTTAIADYFSKYCPDTNGDGKVNVCIVNCAFNKNQKDNTKLTKLQTMIVGDCAAMLFITDDETIGYFDDIREDISFFQENKVVLGDDFYNACEDIHSYLPKKLYVSIRNLKDTQIGENKSTIKYYKTAKEIIDKIK